MASGERVNNPRMFMLGDVVHFTNAVLESNRNRDYEVIAIREDSIDVRTRSTFVDGDRFVYTILGRQLEELGTEIVHTGMG